MSDRQVSRWRKPVLRLAAVAGLLGIITPAAQAELIYMTIRESSAMDPQDKLLTFDSATPGIVNDLGFITGLGSFQYLEGLDFRPLTGELYGLGYTGSVYKIDLATLIATAQGFATAPGSGYTSAGFDFNPVTDRLKVMQGSLDWNASFNPVTNMGNLDSPGIDYAPADPNAPGPTDLSGLAYTNNTAGAATTTLYGIDVRNNMASAVLSIVNPEAAGTLNTVGNLGVTVENVGGFDISGATGIAYAILSDFVPGPPGSNVPTLYTIDLATGLATPVGLVGIDPQAFRVTGLSVAPAAVPPGGGGGPVVPVPAAALVGPLIGAIALAKSRRWRRA